MKSTETESFRAVQQDHLQSVQKRLKESTVVRHVSTHIKKILLNIFNSEIGCLYFYIQQIILQLNERQD